MTEDDCGRLSAESTWRATPEVVGPPEVDGWGMRAKAQMGDSKTDMALNRAANHGHGCQLLYAGALDLQGVDQPVLEGEVQQEARARRCAKATIGSGWSRRSIRKGVYFHW